MPSPSQPDQPPPDHGDAPAVTAWSVFRVFLYLGCTSFGGPVAHLGYFRALLVEKKRWLDDRTYGDLVALCQFLPGPSSSQVGFAIGLIKAGYRGGLAAWLGFTMPSALLMVLFAFSLAEYGDIFPPALISGLKLVAVSVVAHAVLTMGRSLAPDRPRQLIALAAMAILLAVPSPLMQLAVIAAGALAGVVMLPRSTFAAGHGRTAFAGGLASLAFLSLAFGLLAALPMLAALVEHPILALADGFYRAGALVFGGGHVVLPLLKSAVMDPGWVTDAEFLAGYGAAQAIPGPLFTVAAFLGMMTGIGPAGLGGAGLALVAIFLASFLMLLGVMPFWRSLREHALVRRALDGINAAVVGLLLAVLINPIMMTGIRGPVDVAIGLGGFLLLAFGVMRPILVVGLIVLASLGAASIPL
ncbi:chromate efflux transporter [Alphaproteobacteria bacterium LSUCC0684]